MATVAPIILNRRRDVLSDFLGANAVSAGSATAYEPERFIDERLLERMLGSGVIVETTPGRYYVDIPTYDADNRSRRRRVALVMVVLVAAAAVTIYLTNASRF